ncbi:MAG: DNA-binding response regulator [Sphingobacteriaceae bacterium]|nr:DNA-binding response regulator [Sphingobacteriaceae bacterium]
MNNARYKILAVDDEPDILEIIGYNLSKEGYEVLTASNGADAIRIAKEQRPDLIILDIMMPKMDGIETCRQIKEIDKLKNTFVVFLTAREEEFVEIMGFSAGADDYIAKPIKPRALLSRINAILRRSGGKEDAVQPKIQINDLSIDRETYMVTKGNEQIVLAKKEFELLFLLASKPGKVFSRDLILEQIWGNDVVVINRTIDVHIRKLREKIGEDYIQTVKGVGYKFGAE